MENNIHLEKLLDKFASESADDLIAVAIVRNDGIVEASKILEGHDYNVQKSAAILAMLSNVLNSMLCELYEGSENVWQLEAQAKKNVHFMYRAIETGEYYQGVTFKSDSGSANMRQLLEEYEAKFADALK